MVYNNLRAKLLVEYLDLPAASGVDDARFEYFQLKMWNDDSIFYHEDKSRQIAWSFAIAAEAVADAMLNKQSSTFVSINLDEASEKIRYCTSIYNNLRAPFAKPEIIRANVQQVEFDNGARIISLPSRPPRGKARMNVYLDEYAWVADDARIYTAALPIISKGGRLRIGSSVGGESGRHWEISQQKIDPYPDYTRKRTPWWECWAFSHSPGEAIHCAPSMTTADRVAAYGNSRIQAIFSNIPTEDFQQEYECVYHDESSAWITWDEIRAAQSTEHTWYAARGTIGNYTAVLVAIEAFFADDSLEDRFALGVDVGRTRDTTEIFAVGIPDSEGAKLPLRLAITLDGMPFDTQEMIINKIVSRRNIIRCWIDRNGLGMNLAENLEKKHPARVEGVNFTNASKAQWATDAKTLFQKLRVALPADRDIGYQVHSIKRKVSAAKNLIFDTERNEKHHADKFWALALALGIAYSINRHTVKGALFY